MKKRVPLSILLFVSLTLLLAFPVQAASTKTLAKRAYAKYREKHSVQNYKLVDVDKNGGPEMFFLASDYSYGVCGYNKAKKKVVKFKAVNLGKFYPYVYYSKSKHKFALTNSDTGGSRYWVYKVKGKKAALVQTLKSERQYPSYDYYYYINGKKTSSAAFEKAYRSIWKWKKVDLTPTA